MARNLSFGRFHNVHVCQCEFLVQFSLSLFNSPILLMFVLSTFGVLCSEKKSQTRYVDLNRIIVGHVSKHLDYLSFLKYHCSIELNFRYVTLDVNYRC